MAYRNFVVSGMLACALIFSAPLSGQTNQFLTKEDSDPRAVQLLDKMHALLSEDALRLEFQMTVTFPGEEPVSHSGSLTQQGNQYHISTDDAEILSDGKLRWVYFREANEVNIYTAHEEDLQGPIGLVGEFTGEQFIAGITGTEVQNGKTLNLIELKPVDRSSPLSKVRLAVDDTGSLSSAHIFEKSGGRTEMQVLKIQRIDKQQASAFTFDQSRYPGVHVEDLRID